MCILTMSFTPYPQENNMGKDGIAHIHKTKMEGLDATNKKELLYAIDENPPWYLCIFLGFQVRTLIVLLQHNHPFITHTINYINFGEG